MKPSKPLSILALALALAGTITATASALGLPNVLPENASGTTSSGQSNFGNGILEIVSASSTGTFAGTQTKLGTFHITLEKYKTVLTKEECVGLDGDTTGNVLLLGTYHIRARSTTSTTIILLFKPIHFWCKPNILILLTGCVAGILTPNSTLTKTLTATFAKNGTKNDNLVVTVLNEATTGTENCELMSSENGGAAELSALVTTQLLKSEGATEALVMPL